MLHGESFKFISPSDIQGPEKLGDLSEISQLLNSWVQIPTQVFWFQNVVKMLQVLTTCHWDSPVTAPPRIFFQITVPHASCRASSILSLSFLEAFQVLPVLAGPVPPASVPKVWNFVKLFAYMTTIQKEWDLGKLPIQQVQLGFCWELSILLEMCVWYYLWLFCCILQEKWPFF